MCRAKPVFSTIFTKMKLFPGLLEECVANQVPHHVVQDYQVGQQRDHLHLLEHPTYQHLCHCLQLMEGLGLPKPPCPCMEDSLLLGDSTVELERPAQYEVALQVGCLHPGPLELGVV